MFKKWNKSPEINCTPSNCNKTNQKNSLTIEQCTHLSICVGMNYGVDITAQFMIQIHCETTNILPRSSILK